MQKPTGWQGGDKSDRIMRCIAIEKKNLEKTHSGMIGLSPARDGDREFEGGEDSVEDSSDNPESDADVGMNRVPRIPQLPPLEFGAAADLGSDLAAVVDAAADESAPRDESAPHGESAPRQNANNSAASLVRALGESSMTTPIDVGAAAAAALDRVRSSGRGQKSKNLSNKNQK
jgi:hypothetical protein